jgi:hypothetical protein
VFSFRLIATIALITLAACSSDDDPAGLEGWTATSVSGSVVKGPVGGATVEIRALRGDGSPGDVVSTAAQTDAAGRWSAVIPETNQDRYFLVVATGGSYLDEANPTADPVEVPATLEMVSFLDRAHPASIAVTPFTHMMHGQVGVIVSSVGVVESWARVVEKSRDVNSFGFDPTTTLPSSDSSALQNELSYAAFLGGLSVLAQNDMNYAGLSGINSMAVALAIAEDLGDGALDGADESGAPIIIPLTTSALPLTSSTGVQPLNEWTHTYAASTPGFEDVVLPDELVIEPPYSGPINPSCDQLAQLRQAARASLEQILFATLNGPEPEAPRDIDFGATRGLYASVLSCDGGDLEAHLAMAMLELASLAVDPDVNDAFDAWDAYLDSMIPFETERPSSSLALPAGLTGGVIEMPLEAIQRSLMPFLNLRRAVPPPQIATIQDILRHDVLPRVLTAIGHMDAVLAQPDYTFAITPRMQGDTLEEVREADFTDFLALRAGLRGLEASLRIAISYELNLEDYTGAVLVAGLTQGTGSLFTLKGDGATQMRMVPDLLIAAADDLDAAITALFAETDNQSDDLIKIGPRDLVASELTEFQTVDLDLIRQALAGEVTYVYDWDFSTGTPDVSLAVNINAFFSNPQNDLKDLLPPYSMSLEVFPYNLDWIWYDEYQNLTFEVPDAGYFSANCSVSYVDFVVQEPSCDAPTWASGQLQALLDAEVARITAVEDWDGQLSVSVQFWADIAAPGTHAIPTTTYISYGTIEGYVEAGLATFEADTFADWLAQWPDPTLGGLFPQVTSAAEIAGAFGWTGEDWSKAVSLNWAGDDIPAPPIPAP